MRLRTRPPLLTYLLTYLLRPWQLGRKRDAQSFEIFSKFLADERLRRWEYLFQVSV